MIEGLGIRCWLPQPLLRQPSTSAEDLLSHSACWTCSSAPVIQKSTTIFTPFLELLCLLEPLPDMLQVNARSLSLLATKSQMYLPQRVAVSIYTGVDINKYTPPIILSRVHKLCRRYPLLPHWKVIPTDMHHFSSYLVSRRKPKDLLKLCESVSLEGHLS